MKKILYILLILPLFMTGQGWETSFGSTGCEDGRSVQQTTDGGYVVCGYTTSFWNNSDVYLIKTDGNGDSLWTKTYGGIQGNGNITSTLNIPRPNLNIKVESIVDVLGREAKPKSNTPLFYIYDDGTVEKLIIIE